MYVRACKLHEDTGRALPRHRLAMLRPVDLGWLVYRECYDQEHKRIMMMARLLGEPGQPDVYPELRDAVMMVAENSVMTIRGLERTRAFCATTARISAAAVASEKQLCWQTIPGSWPMRCAQAVSRGASAPATSPASRSYPRAKASARNAIPARRARARA
ncbi:hypothetical protein [Rugamonas apoptosis]|uniref:Uncharacterized protein n=1 Tax=Rugamonas apoptosis TaxID=2758570 RepID=A0A7W2INI9_9BURK|nr:hypothetical protein [Rugamonas apoptosis]MBA5690646.1 hypothetical protein [Rugamonas apoptosis]